MDFLIGLPLNHVNLPWLQFLEWTFSIDFFCWTFCWTFLLDIFVRLFCWTFLLDFFVKLFCWTFMLDFYVGLLCWTFMLDFICWTYLLDFFVRLFCWLHCKCITDWHSCPVARDAIASKNILSRHFCYNWVCRECLGAYDACVVTICDGGDGAWHGGPCIWGTIKPINKSHWQKKT